MLVKSVNMLLFSVIIHLVTVAIQLIAAVPPLKRFEYKTSFKGPHLVQRDGTIPFWEHGGHAIASDESVRITPSLRSKRGYIWSREKMTQPNWEVEMTFRVNGRGRIGADGLAFWYTREKGKEGPVFGSNDMWDGLGVFFDSFDNDGQHNNPYIMAMGNDGSLKYDHNSDGSSQQLGGCLRDFRNKPFPVKAKIEYYEKTLTIHFHSGMTNNDQDYELCLRVENVNLPAVGHFGISAATGGLADDHDVSSFLVHSLQSPVDVPDMGQQVSDDERKKFEQEYEDYRKKLEQAKDDYRKQHPDQKMPEEDQWFEGQDVRELKMIFDGQNSIHDTVRHIHRKLDEVIGRQEQTLSQMSNMGRAGMPQGSPQGQGQQQQLPNVDTIKRHEVDSVLSSQRELSQNVRDIRAFVNDVQAKLNTITQQVAGNRGTADSAYDNQRHQQQVMDTITGLQNNVKTLINQQGAPPKCPPPPATNCVTTIYFFLMVCAQLAVFIGYAVYRSNREAAAKKFY